MVRDGLSKTVAVLQFCSCCASCCSSSSVRALAWMMTTGALVAGRCGGGDVLVLVEQAAGCAVSCRPVPFESGGRG